MIRILDMSKQVACIEIKTRVATNKIDLAESAMKQYGRIEWCWYDDDDIFKKCVHLGNRGHVICQACVTNFNIGIFVTSKAGSEEGSIIQIIVVQFTMNDFKQC